MDPLTGMSMHKISRTASITPFATTDINRAALMTQGDALASLEEESKPHDLVK
jgi:hypothetical protein